MFEIPKWGDDIPKANVHFGRGNSVKGKKQKKIDDSQVSLKSPEKSNNNKNTNNQNVVNKGKKKGKNDRLIRPQQKNDMFTKKRNVENKKQKNNSFKQRKSVKLKPNIATVSPEMMQREKSSITSKTKIQSRKRKHDHDSVLNTENSTQFTQKPSKNKKKKIELNIHEDIPDIATGTTDENIIIYDGADGKTVLPIKTKVDKKKEKIKMILQTQNVRNHIKTSSTNLRQRMLERLKAAQFRYLNEKLYTSSGAEAKKLFQSDPDAFNTYHQGYQLQVKKWPVNPLDLIVKRISKMYVMIRDRNRNRPKTHIIADMGCGEAALSSRVSQKVRSFDLVSTNPAVEACDMAHTPLLTESADVAVYCLALMGTELTQYLVEANRVLKDGGHLLIAEVESRFEKLETFTEDVQRLGFKLKNLDKSHNVFFFMEFTKVRGPPVKKSKLPSLTLKPCLYKKR